jgi:pimeloyl-ACP methyl ester carboxylesterase
MKKSLIYAAAILAFVFLVLPFLLPLPGERGRPASELVPGTGRLLRVAGVQTYVEEAGPESGQAVILIHGFGGSTFSWRETIPALAAAGYRAVALDLKGFGLADKTLAADYSHAAQAEFVIAVMEALDVEQATLIGHSMGGNVAAHLALAQPERVEKLVLVDAAIVPGGDGGPPFSGASWLARFPPAQRWARLLLRTAVDEARFRSILNSAVYDPVFVDDALVSGYRRSVLVEDWDLALLGIVRDSRDNALPAAPGSLAMPVLLIWGEADTWVATAQGEWLAATISGAEYVTIDKAGHLPMEEQPELFNRILLDFLARSAAP